jgi:hypothetical protein
VGRVLTWYRSAIACSLREPSVSTFTATKAWALRTTQGSTYVD